MKKILISFILISSVTVNAMADELKHFDIMPVLEQGYASGKLSKDIKFVFGSAKKAKGHSLGEFSTNKKTNGFGKDSQKSCEHAFLSAMIEMQERAQKLKAKTIANIKSNFKSKEFASETQFECGDGFLMSGVALKGDFYK